MIRRVANCDSIWANHSSGSLGQKGGALSGQLRLVGQVDRLETSLVEGRRLATHVRVTNVGRL